MFRASFRKELVCTSGETGNASSGPYEHTTAEAICLFTKVCFLSRGFDAVLTLRKNRRVYGEKFKLASAS
jgi:hypothetical protein